MAIYEGERKLAAILSADVVGYSKLMADDERATVNTLKEYRLAIARVIERHKGRVVNAPGDNILADFPSAVEAVQSACEIQQVLKGRNLELAADRRMEFRIGVNLGDVIEEADGTIYGDGVNIAARMEALAEGGGICISSSVYDAVEGKIEFGFDFLGEQQVKNIAKPINVYRVRTEGKDAPSEQPAHGVFSRGFVAAAAVVVVVLAGVIVWLITDRSQPEPEVVAEDAAGAEVAVEATPETAPENDPILAMPTGPTIAVLPFTNTSGDPEQEYFSDGITEEIITELSRRSNLFVIARNSTFRYKGQSVDVRQVGQELGARYVLEGSVRKAGGTIRVTVQLLASTDGTTLWAETYERELSGENLFDVQDQITENVVGAIGGAYGAIHRAGLQASRGKAPGTLEAYDCVLRAITMLRRISPQAHLSARDCLETAVEQEPDYAEAWAWLSYVYHFEYSLGFNPRPNSLERGLTAARQALVFDSSSQLGHQQLAYNYFLTKQQGFFEKAEEAIAINPNNPDVIAAVGYYLSYAGKWERGAALIHKAIALNPDLPGAVYSALSAYAYVQRDYDEALRWAVKIEIPPWWKTHALLAISYGQLGMQEEATQAVNDLLAVYPSYAENARREFRKYYWDETELEHVMDGFRKAGLDIPDEPVADN